MWHLTGDTWQVAHDRWHMTCDMWNMKWPLENQVVTKLKNSNCDKLKYSNCDKLKNSTCDHAQTLKWWQNLKTQIVTKLKKIKGPRDLGKYKSSEWLLDKLAISWSFGFFLKMSKMLRSETWNQNKMGAFFVNFFWCNISSKNCFHKLTYTT